MHFLVDDRVLAASDERLPEVVVRKRLLLARQRDSALLNAVQHHAHLVYRPCFPRWGEEGKRVTKCERGQTLCSAVQMLPNIYLTADS